MIKNISLRKISVTTCAFFIVLMIYLFPKTSSKLNVEKNIVYKDNGAYYVYLIDENDYLARVSVPLESNDKTSIIKEKINILLNNTTDSFVSPIPRNTKILNATISDDLLKLNFSKSLLLVTRDNEEKLIETLIYTCLDSEINKLEIMVDNKLLKELPVSKKVISYPLTKGYGINKKYDITSLNNIDKTTVYYFNNKNDEVYYVPVTHITNKNTEKINIIIDELKSSVLFQSNLNSYLSNKAVLEDYEIVEKTMFLTFNDKIFDNIDKKEILEEVKYTIKESIKDNYDVNEVVFKVLNSVYK
ncbi:MAG: GerMN domain-containing protein [Bacilli bacterium]